ncbi:MAG: hypothetical protein AAF135_26055 [Bacteroidota bacterium]
MMRKYMGVVMLLASFVVFGIRIYDGVVINQNVTGHLKNAADANTVELAEQELTIALNYLEANGLTEGYTSILYDTPKDDISFWYRNLKASQEELRTLSTSSSLEKTNVLMKLRETLVDVGESTKVTMPRGLGRHPHNGIWAGVTTSALIALVWGLVLVLPKEAFQTESGKNKE